MCGIAGFIDFKKNSDRKDIEQMICTLNHRGPDSNDVDYTVSDNYVAAFGHARLAIIDLSEKSNQPMNYKDLTLVFNGEIYNYKEIRNDLLNLGHVFQTDGDSEVILHAFDEWKEACVHRFIGMFAFVIYDKLENEIYAFRDRPGVKPFYYYWDGELFLFASELKAIIEHPSFKSQISNDSVEMFFKFGYVPAPYCIFDQTYKLNPGTLLRFNLTNKSFENIVYWDVREFYQKPKLDVSYEDAKEKLKEIFNSAVNYRMIADVPVGVFLSGGYDSSLVTALLQKNRKSKIRTFTIGFEEGNNEAPYADAVASYLNTEHTEYVCSTKDAQNIIKDLPYFFDEPFSDSSAIPTVLVSRLAKEKVTVVLSADGGDESFAGYDRYNKFLSNIKKFDHINKIGGPLLASVFFKLSNIFFLKNSYRHKLSGLATALEVKDRVQREARIFKEMHSAPQFLIDSFLKKESAKDLITEFDHFTGYNHSMDYVLTSDYKMYLQNDILTKVDRATMSSSIEGREPLLDHRIIEYAAQLPLSFKMNNTNGNKAILKDIVHDLIPKSIMDRPKAGFSIPINDWLKNDLSYLIDDFLSKEQIESMGIFNTSAVVNIVNDFKRDKLYYNVVIWRLLIFSMWHKKWIKS